MTSQIWVLSRGHDHEGLPLTDSRGSPAHWQVARTASRRPGSTISGRVLGRDDFLQESGHCQGARTRAAARRPSTQEVNSQMKMRDLLSIPRVIPRLRARAKQDALRKLAARAAGDVGVSVAAIVRSLLECAELPAFGLGAGVSLAHTFVPGLGSPIATFARLEPALDFGASDGSKTDLLALLLSPTESASHHLRALACIARTLRDPDVRSLLRASGSRDSLYVILCGNDEQHWSREPGSAKSSLRSQL